MVLDPASLDQSLFQMGVTSLHNKHLTVCAHILLPCLEIPELLFSLLLFRFLITLRVFFVLLRVLPYKFITDAFELLTVIGVVLFSVLVFALELAMF